MTLVSIDPGLDGACAVFSGRSSAWVFDLPTVEEAMTNGKTKRHIDAVMLGVELASIEPAISKAVVERVTSSPQQGVRSAFSMGEGLGVILGVLGALKISVEFVLPCVWKRGMKVPPGAGKEHSRALAIRLYPECVEYLKRKRDHGRAEALLIGHYARGLR